jgi:hypothetical protein
VPKTLLKYSRESVSATGLKLDIPVSVTAEIADVDISGVVTGQVASDVVVTLTGDMFLDAAGGLSASGAASSGLPTASLATPWIENLPAGLSLSYERAADGGSVTLRVTGVATAVSNEVIRLVVPKSALFKSAREDVRAELNADAKFDITGVSAVFDHTVLSAPVLTVEGGDLALRAKVGNDLGERVAVTLLNDVWDASYISSGLDVSSWFGSTFPLRAVCDGVSDDGGVVGDTLWMELDWNDSMPSGGYVGGREYYYVLIPDAAMERRGANLMTLHAFRLDMELSAEV